MSLRGHLLISVSPGVFDQRVSSYGGKVHAAKEHNSWIVSAHLRADIPEVRGRVLLYIDLVYFLGLWRHFVVGCGDVGCFPCRSLLGPIRGW